MLADFGSATKDWSLDWSTAKKEELENLVTDKIVKEEGGIFSWKDSKGGNRQVYVKKNRSFIDRKHAQLRYQLYKKIESQTNTGKLKKEWKEGQMYINGKAVTINLFPYGGVYTTPAA